MHAYLIVGDEGKISEKIEEIVKKSNSSLFEFALSKIDDVRALSEFTRLKITQKTAILVKNIDNASIETLNACLKSLEEPQENLTYILTAENRFRVIDTIISRCQVINVGKPSVEDDGIIGFYTKTAGEQLRIIEKIKDRAEAINFTNKLLLGLQKKLTDKDVSLEKYQFIIKKTYETYKALKKNGNIVLQMTNLVIQLDQKD